MSALQWMSVFQGRDVHKAGFHRVATKVGSSAVAVVTIEGCMSLLMSEEGSQRARV